MVQRRGGSRRKTRTKLKKPKQEKGKISIRKFLAEYTVGEKVILKGDPALQKGMFHPRFKGKSGIVKKKTGSCYEVTIKDFTKKKIVVVHPIHLERSK
ncbi:MAG: 50S ribosomal protein L21e [Nanoarchaeota archaeon]|nr:50S ribosomal protein L21e [Nanoarchaeota archaeon]